MLYTWERKDVQPGRVVRSKTTAVNNKLLIAVDLCTFYLIALSDGMVVHTGSQESLRLFLNEHSYCPTDDDRATTKAIDWLRGIR